MKKASISSAQLVIAIIKAPIIAVFVEYLFLRKPRRIIVKIK